MSITAIIAAGYVTSTPEGKHLTTSEIATLHALAFCTGERSVKCFPSNETICDLTGLSVRTVRTSLKALEDAGFITRETCVGRANIFTLNVEAMRACHRKRRWSDTRDAAHPTDNDAEIITTVSELASGPDCVPTNADAPVEAEPPAPATVDVPAPVPAAVQTELIPAPAKKKTKKGDTTPALDEAFEEFYYRAYPRRMEPLKARRAFEKAVKNGADPRDIIDGARSFAAATAAKEVTYIPYPASWLNAGGWMNEAGDIAPVERTPWQAKTARMIQPVQAAAVVNNAPALTGAPATAPAAPLAIEPGYI